MSISFPLSFPTSPSFKRMELRATNVVGISESPVSKEQQVYEWDGDGWEASITWPMMNRASADPIVAVLQALRGRRGTVLLPLPKNSSPRGIGTGTAFVKDAQTARSRTMTTRGWTGSQTGILKAGDFIRVQRNYIRYPVALDNGAWAKSEVTVSANSQTDPEGSSSEAERFTSNVGAFDPVVLQEAINACIPNFPITFSIWLRVSTGALSVAIRLHTYGGGTFIAQQSCALTTTWQRFTLTATPTQAHLDESPNLRVSVGGDNSWPASTSIDIWGASLYSDADAKLYQNLTDTNSSIAGWSTLDIFPKQREATPDFSRIVVNPPKGLFRLASNDRLWTMDEAGNYSLGAEFVEAL